jgi:hypothetical protein
MTQRLPKVFYNPISLIGFVIAAFNVGFIVFLSVVEALSGRAHPYADLVIWMILPAFVLVGVALIVVGVRRERRREREGKAAERRVLVIDFNDPKHRTTSVVLLSGFLLLSLLYAFAGFKAYEFTESKTFCGMMCHQVMGPEFRSHSYSAHAEIACADCHVGPGAKHFVIGKLKGTRQLIHLVLDRVPKPIPTPVTDLRPSQEVCENCHGPKYQINQRLESRSFFLSDKQNTRKTVNLLLRMGGDELTPNTPPKMHWHSGTTQEIDYVASDEKRTTIPWIRVKRLDGKERVYRVPGAEMSDAEAAKVGMLRMDCADCHNRAGHPYHPPQAILNALLTLKLVDPELPEIKRVAVEALGAEYASREEALKGIDSTIRGFYAKAYPDISRKKEAEIAAAIGALGSSYARNYDPYMKVSWKSFPDNRGHRYSAGCFRCHDGQHKSDDGAVLSRDCSACHLLIERTGETGTARPDRAVFQVMKYPHPVDIGDAWKETPCHGCHG